MCTATIGKRVARSDLYVLFHLSVGAGSAGSVVANRLSANGKLSILLLEAGEEESRYPLMHIPLAAGENCGQGACMWNDYTTPQDNCQGFNQKVWHAAFICVPIPDSW